MSRDSAPAAFIETFSAIADRYDAVICDVWGVLHNGVRITRPANDALIAMRERGMAVVMLTNAPRPPADIVSFIRQLGADERAWDAVVSSGGVTRSIMAGHEGRPFYHMGPKRDVSVYEGLAGTPTPLEQADYVLCTGLVDDESETAEDYRPQLDRMLARRLELICANPDIVVERGHALLPCAGAIAELYERMGGPVTWVGKPHPLVYDFALAEIEKALDRPVPRSRILGIGDALRTDVAGARGFGIDALFVLDGIHAREAGLKDNALNMTAAADFISRSAMQPRWAMRFLRF